MIVVPWCIVIARTLTTASAEPGFEAAAAPIIYSPRLWNSIVVADAATTIHTSALTTARVVATPTAFELRPA